MSTAEQQSKLAEYVRELEGDLRCERNPPGYQNDEEFYSNCRARADMLEEIIRRLKEIQNG